MLREIRKRLVILHNRSPFRQEVKDCLNDLEYREWIYMNLRLSGSSLTKDNIDTILRGGYILEATVEDHLMIDRLGELRKYIYRLTDMEASLSQQIIRDMHAIITGGEAREDYRKSSPVLLEYGISPMMPADIPQAMAEAVYFAASQSGAGNMEPGENPIQKAVLLHNRILEIYPFKEGNDVLARAVMYYVLAAAGYPMAALALSEQEYNQLFITYVKHGESSGLAEALGRAVFQRLELMMQLTEYGN